MLHLIILYLSLSPTSHPLAIADPSGKLYQPTAKQLFRDELIKLTCDLIEKNPPNNAVHTYDWMAIVSRVASQKTCRELWRLVLKRFTPNRVHSPQKNHIVYSNYTDDQTFSVKQTKQVSQAAGEWKRLHIGNDSRKMPQGHDYKD